MPPLLKVENLVKHFPLRRGVFSRAKGEVQAVNEVSFEIKRGETLGLVGESGSGKTTIGRCVLRLIEPTRGKVMIEDTEVTGLPLSSLKELRCRMQIIFQDPYGSLSPRMRLYSILREPLDVHGIGSESERREAVAAMLEKVGLRPGQMYRYPHEFSGGQRQRIAIARALMLNPDLVVADEPVSALDVSIRAQIINLMVQLQQEFGLSYLLITHDLSVVKYMSDHIAVLYLGRIVELANKEDLYRRPQHPYTEALMSAIPVPKVGGKKERIYLSGEIPSPINPPSGCAFHPRCRYKIDECSRVAPELKSGEDGHLVACHLR